MKKHVLFLMLLSANFFISGCNYLNCCMQGVISVSPDQLEFPPEGVTSPETVSVTSNMHWRLLKPTNFPSWLQVCPELGTGSQNITVSAGPETNGTGRNYTLFFMAANGDMAKLVVTQPLRSFIPTAKVEATDQTGFWMGTNFDNPDGPNYWNYSSNYEAPVHRVILSAFRMGITEVTNEQYAFFLNEKKIGYSTDLNYYDENCPGGEGLFQGKTYPFVYDSQQDYWEGYCRNGITHDGDQWISVEGCGDYPVIYVTWYGAMAFCQWLSEATGQTWRLPTEAEWEYACRAGAETLWCFGNDEDDLDAYGWYDSNSEGSSHPVKKKEKNNNGLYDMHGNVLEWCMDYWTGDVGYPSGPATNPMVSGDTDIPRVLRGGCWFWSANDARSAARSQSAPDYAYGNIGFRVVQEL